MTHRSPLTSRLLAALALLALCAAPPLLLLAVQGSPLPDWATLRSGQLDDDTWLKLFGCLVWLLWGQFLLGTLLEAHAVLRQVPVPRVTFGQDLSRRLITAIVATSIAAPALLTGTARAHADPVPASPAALTPAAAAPARTTPAPPKVTPTGPVYVVGSEPDLPPRLWSIAQAHLGDPRRWSEIWQLNAGSLQPDGRTFTDPDVIRYGWRLVLPADATGLPGKGEVTSPHEVTVRPGDTLTGIAAAELGDAAAWPRLFAANEGRPEPGGAVLDDPDLIRPGWKLTVPPAAAPPRPKVTSPHPSPPRPAPPRTGPGSPVPSPPPSSPSAVPSSVPSGSPTASPPKAGDHAAPAAVPAAGRYVGLFAGAGLLAASAAAALLAGRRRQCRQRRLGMRIAPQPDDLAALERELVANAPLPNVEWLDRALRGLAAGLRLAGAERLPDLAAARYGADDLELWFADLAQLPEPWVEVEPTRWLLPRSADLAVDDAVLEAQPAPYPCLVAVGHDGHGRDWLLDLEHAGTVSITGDATRSLDLLRYLAAELANNPWADHVAVTVAGFGAELVDANPTRLASAEDLDVLAAQLQADIADAQSSGDALAGRLLGGERWLPQVLLAAPALSSAPVLRELLDRQGGAAGRTTVAVVVTGSGGTRWDLHVGADGTLTVRGDPVPDRPLLAHGVSAEVAADLARLIAVGRDGEDVAVPPSPGSAPVDHWIDAAGALLPAHTTDREPGLAAAGEDGVAVPTSVLPMPTQVYVRKAATTAADVAALAPAVPKDVRDNVERAAAELDAHLADWQDETCTRPKIRLLGPPQVIAHGRPPGRKGLCLEAVAYLATRAHPVSTDQWVLDFWPDREDYRGTNKYPINVIGQVRYWLGTDPTGAFYLARLGRKDSGDGYQLRDELLDVELFRLLRARGEARGADGLSDLQAALDLVTGPPLHNLPAGRWTWLEPGQAELYTGMVLDVAHLVATQSLAIGDAAAARAAAELALKLDPVNEAALCDLAAAFEAEGSDGALRATVTRLTTLDELSDRTHEILRRRRWFAS